MQYSFAKACLLALATTTSVLAQIPGFNVLTAPASNEVLQAGEKFTIKWTPSDPPAPITLLLMQGKNAQGLEIAAEPIAKSIDSGLGKFEWSVPSSAPFAAYGILLQLDSNTEQFQYSNPFTIAGGEGGEGGATTGPSEGTISISASEPTKTSGSAKSTTTIQISQISTAPTSSTTKALSTTSKAPEPTTTSTSEKEEESTSTVESTTAAPSTTEAPSTTLETSVAPPTSTEAPTAPSATPSLTGAASRSAVVGSGILGAMVMVFALF
ncbi:hypothetical protein V496_03513 [Pseudogymnoascus sp. VKM F-4515 (FW-2607)]|nr:hypothetical protein V496_03513 [Pseudogymnoascus sp. VKM F-4515 (FW-2607)]KFY68387.1 hypothetical protein V498_10650 [Pseudogymnoascus sp. VKM F-4517 (FW-2822)]